MDYNDVFTYKDGELFWKVSPSRKVRVGDKAGSMGKDYYRVGYKGKTSIFVHKIIWEMHNGKVPNGMQVDHINQNKLDNRLENLRLATPAQNNHNSSRSGGNSGYKGVYKAGWKEGKWFAKLTIGGKQRYFGTHDSEESAAEAVNKAYRDLHGPYANINEFERKIQHG
jgi:hypothetical protein